MTISNAEIADKIGAELVREINRLTLRQLQDNPTTPILSLDLLDEDTVVQFITSRRAGTFGDFFVQTPSDKHKAAVWFCRTVREYFTYLHQS